MSDTEPTRPDPNTRSRGERAFNIFLIAACVLLAILVVLLSLQNRRLKEQLAVQVPAMPADALEQGDVLDALYLLDERGESVEVILGEGQPTTLLLFYSPDCPACAETLPVWAELLQDPPAGLRIVAVRLSPQPEDVPYLPFPVYTPDKGGLEFMHKIPYIPATVLIEGDRVEAIWFGVLDPAARGELQAAIAAAG